MYTCNGCGGYLRFDIDSQSLKCESCGNLCPVPEEKDREMEAEYRAKIYTCPQCGAELVGDDNEAVVFCSFCESSNVLTERYENEKKPAKIIPFKITKERCKEIYAERLKSARFAPSILKDPKHIESFRGIYMPFYLYEADINEHVTMDGETVERRGDTDYITEYSIDTDVSGSYSDIPHDASSSFADDISESIVPFNDKDAKAFATGYMSGFYADTADVDKEIYVEDVKDVIERGIARELTVTNAIPGMNITDGFENKINPEIKDVKIGLFPVWFLSYRNKDRIAYAAINGQTGKMSIDIPVDIRKFYLIALIMALPIFLILNFVVTLTPQHMMFGTILLSLVAMAIAFFTEKDIKNVLSGASDRGLSSVGAVKQKGKTTKPFRALLIVGIVISVAITLIDPVVDTLYYIGAFLDIVFVAITIAYLVKVYNRISTRPLPQFKRRGGKDNA